MRNNFLTYKTIGLGNPKKIAIAMNGHGIGDDISAMPAIAQKISEGFDITVFCKPFSRKCWTSLGCKVYPSVNPKNELEENVKFGAFIGNNFEGKREVFTLKNEFGVVYETPQWSIWEKENGGVFFEDRIKAFADIIETTLPENFSWVNVLNPQKWNRDFVLFAPDSATTTRTLLSQNRIFRKLKKKFEVVVFGQPALYHRGKKVVLPKRGKESLVRVAISTIVCKTYNGLVNFFNRKLDREKKLCSTFEEFLAYIYSAKLVVSTDNGVMNTARAFGIPCVSIFGSTREIASLQYDKYVKAPRTVVRCDYGEKGIKISDQIEFILERTKQWQKQHIMAG